MKTIEQKAKAYDEAIERAKKVHKYSSDLAEIKRMEDIFPELRKSVDEKVRKELIKVFSNREKYLIDQSFGDITVSEALAWLEKQGEQKPTDKVESMEHGYITTNSEFFQWIYDRLKNVYNENPNVDYMLSLKERIEDMRKPTDIKIHEGDKNNPYDMSFEEAQYYISERGFDICCVDYPVFVDDKYILQTIGNILKWADDNPKRELFDNIKPKFKVGDCVVDEDDNSVRQIECVLENVTSGNFSYDLVGGGYFPSTKKNYHLWSIEDAKDGDILYSPEHNLLWIYKNKEECHAAVNLNYANSISFGSDIVIPSDVCPATKEQRETIFSKMHEFGYEWDDKEKELKKIEDEEYDGEDYGIDSLWHAHRILEKTLGEVDGYQTDDGILSHKCAITAVKKLYEQKPAGWSEEDRDYYDAIITKLEVTQDDAALTDNQMEFLKSLKDRVHLKQEWSEEDEIKIKSIIAFLKSPSLCAMDGNKDIIDANIKYLKSIKDRVQPQPKQEWGEEDEENLKWFEKFFRAESVIAEGKDIPQERYLWFKNLKYRVQPQNTWKPSDEQMEALEHFIIHHNGSTNYAKDLEELRIQLKKL